MTHQVSELDHPRATACAPAAPQATDLPATLRALAQQLLQEGGTVAESSAATSVGSRQPHPTLSGQDFTETPGTPDGVPAQQMQQLVSSLLAEARVQQRLLRRQAQVVVQGRQGVHIFQAADVGGFYAINKYVMFRHASVEWMVSETLNQLEDRLKTHGFARAHRSALVNLAQVRRVCRIPGGMQLELVGGDKVALSRRAAPDILRLLRVPQRFIKSRRHSRLKHPGAAPRGATAGC
jgi:hypothetical protein